MKPILSLFCLWIALFCYLPDAVGADRLTSGQLSDEQQLVVKNEARFTLNITVENTSTGRTISRHLQPGQQMLFPERIRRSNAKQIRITTGYDLKAYNTDLSRVRYVYRQRERDRQNSIIMKSILIGADQLFFDGFFTNAYTILEYGGMLLEGASAEEWGNKIIRDGASNAAINSVDKRWQKGAVAAAFELVGLLEEGSYSDLERYTADALKTLGGNSMTSTKRASSYNLAFPKRAAFPNLSLEASVFLPTTFSYVENDEKVWSATQDKDFFGAWENTQFAPYNIGGRLDFPAVGLSGGYAQSALLNIEGFSNINALQAQWYYARLNIHSGSAKTGTKVTPLLNLALGADFQTTTFYQKATDGSTDIQVVGEPLNSTFLHLGIDLGLTFNRGWQIKGGYSLATTLEEEDNDADPGYNRTGLHLTLVIPLVRFKWE